MSRQRETICWKCGNACSGCSWSRDFTPVKGWTVKPTTVKEWGVHDIGSYIVIKCPEFVDDTAQYRPNASITPPTTAFRKASRKSLLRKKVESIPKEILEKLIDEIGYFPEVARMALIEQKSSAEIGYITDRTDDSVRKKIKKIVEKIAEAV